eukprot:1406424-Prymnesium_polylepis.1
MSNKISELPAGGRQLAALLIWQLTAALLTVALSALVARVAPRPPKWTRRERSGTGGEEEARLLDRLEEN